MHPLLTIVGMLTGGGIALYGGEKFITATRGADLLSSGIVPAFVDVGVGALIFGLGMMILGYTIKYS